jgi:protein SCO1/2
MTSKPRPRAGWAARRSTARRSAAGAAHRLAATMTAASVFASCGSGVSPPERHDPHAAAHRLRGPPAPQYQNRPAPSFSLADARGGSLTSRQLTGMPYAVTFLYTRCTDSCPLIAAELRRALVELHAQAGHVAVVAISVDPRHDSPAAVRRWLGRRREPVSFHYLIGTERRLIPVWDRYRVDGQDPRYPDDTHSAVIYLVDKHQRTRALYPAKAAVSSHDIAHDLRALLREN